MDSSTCPNAEGLYKFAGRMFGLALMRGQCIGAHLSLPVFALMMMRPIGLQVRSMPLVESGCDCLHVDSKHESCLFCLL